MERGVICKLRIYKLRLFLLSVFMVALLPAFGDEGPEFVTINGVVKDAYTKKKLGFATIFVPGTTVGTITNIDGEFTIKLKTTLEAGKIEVSFLGYKTLEVEVNGEDMSNIQVLLEPEDIMLPEALVEKPDPQMILREAVRRKGDNYLDVATLLTTFYRETIQKRRNFINISEGVLDVFKTPYIEDVDEDYVQIYKGRQIMSQKAKDTLLVKLLGGPNIAVFVDLVKNQGFLLDQNMFVDYKYWMEASVNIEGRPHFVISFAPQIVLPYALYEGKLYIDKKTFTFSRAEIGLDMSDKSKVTQAILKKKPVGLRFKPEKVTYLITYKEYEGRSYLYYVRNEVHFKCDWKRKLFSTNYQIASEVVTTNRRDFNQKFRLTRDLYYQVFRPNQIFSDRVASFYDEAFWEDYNIIEPTESLESAVNRLRRQLK